MKEAIAGILKKALKELKVDLKKEEIERFLETPPSSDMGDYAFPCFFLASKLKQEPSQIALEIRGKIGTAPEDFESIQTSGPYINFFLDRKKMAVDLVRSILAKKDNFGKIDIGKKQKALVEHTSINPNASPHVGRVRNAIIGDSIVRILEFVNFKPEVHYYVNDVSKQIAMLVLAKAEKLKFENMLKKYIQISKKVKKSEKLEKQVFELLRKFEDGNRETVSKFRKITKTCVKGQKEILSEIGINYDYFDYESDYLSKAKDVFLKLSKTKKLHKDKEKRFYLDQKSTPVEKKMKSPVLVLTRSDGTGLYPLRDIAYTLDKLKKSGKNIIILGEDQKLYFLQINEALKLLGQASPEVVHYSFILLKGKGKTKKMSTRKGDIVLLSDFLDEAIDKAKKAISKRETKGDPKNVAISAIKYSILKNNPNKAILFDLNEALNFEGDTGPYMLYSYARASSILRKAKKAKKQSKLRQLEPKEIELISKLSQFQEIILNSYKNLNPSLIANYSYQLAKIFNEFYHACPVIGSPNESFRLSLVEAFRIVLKNSLSLLGIETLERM
ncbi:arginine--tRNA ligase [archaeon BMS3Abin17]|nr:arginine--tRNA ligase [archaeon BMS3Abin17]HDZ61088.1 arginine--tRNA ligase [Candidatus Pacearchaeota archaeon]